MVRHWKKRVAGFAVLGLVLVCLVGILFFLMALQPCRLLLTPDSLVAYDLEGEQIAVDADGRELGHARTWAKTVHLLCLSDDNEAALVTPGDAGRSDEVTLLRFEENGAVRRMDPALRLLPDGKALGPFDFNLLPLPEGLERSWRVNVVYAVPPPGKRNIEGRVRRITNGIRPEFELTIPRPIEWVDDKQGERYVQIRKLVCRYRFDTSMHIVDQATLSFQLGVERDGGAAWRRYTVRMRARVEQQGDGDALAMRDLALATTRLQRARRQGVGSDRLQLLGEEIRRHLLQADPDGPLARVARAVANEIGVDRQAPGVTAWYVQVATVMQSRRAAAERVVADLRADEYPAELAVSGTRLVIRVGPYAQRSDAVLAVFRERFRAERPLWVQARR